MQVPQIILERSTTVDFPSAYRQALVYLEQAAKVDEVKNFSDKIAAAATYYKQKNDREAMNWMKRIQLNSATRLGQVLKQIRIRMEAMETTGDAAQEQSEANYLVTPIERLNCIRIADMDQKVRADKINSDRPPSVNSLAALARKLEYPVPPPLTQEQIRDAELNNEKRRLAGTLTNLMQFSKEHSAKEALKLLTRPISDEFGEPRAFDHFEATRVAEWLKSMAKLHCKNLNLVWRG